MHTRWARPLRKAGGLSCTTCCTRSRHFTYSSSRRRKPRKCSAVRMEPGTASARRRYEPPRGGGKGTGGPRGVGAHPAAPRRAAPGWPGGRPSPGRRWPHWPIIPTQACRGRHRPGRNMSRWIETDRQTWAPINREMQTGRLTASNRQAWADRRRAGSPQPHTRPSARPTSLLTEYRARKYGHQPWRRPRAFRSSRL